MSRTWRSILSARGFTLVELIVVIVVLAIVSGVAITKYNDHSSRARRTVFIDKLRTLSRVFRQYEIDNQPALFSCGVDTYEGSGLEAYFQDNPFRIDTVYGIPWAYISGTPSTPSTILAGYTTSVATVCPPEVYDGNFNADALAIDQALDDGSFTTGALRFFNFTSEDGPFCYFQYEW